eukprot:1351817-Prymnesium_polylepis.1
MSRRVHTTLPLDQPRGGGGLMCLVESVRLRVAVHPLRPLKVLKPDRHKSGAHIGSPTERTAARAVCRPEARARSRGWHVAECATPAFVDCAPHVDA